MHTTTLRTFALWLILCLGFTNSCPGYETIDITHYATSHHRDVFDRSDTINRFGGGRGFTAWYPPGETQVHGIPFAIPERAYDSISGSMIGIESYRTPIKHPGVIYLLASADLTNKTQCDDLSLFNLEVIYEDNSSEEILPVNLLTRQACWYDSQFKEAWVNQFNTQNSFSGDYQLTAGITVYAFSPTRSMKIEEVIFNDNDKAGDYAIFAVTVSDQGEPWIRQTQKVRFHPPAQPTPQMPARTQKQNDMLLVDISPYCNQSAQRCFDLGYGHGRGIVAGLSDALADEIRTYSEIPFQLSPQPKNVISGSVKGMDSFTVPVNAAPGRAYLLMTRNNHQVMSFYNPNWADHPFYISVDVIYVDGDVDTYYPRDLTTGQYRVYSQDKEPGLRVYVIEPIVKEIQAIRVNEKMEDSDLVWAGLTLDMRPSQPAVKTVAAPQQCSQPAPAPPQISSTDKALILENAYYRLEFHRREGSLNLTQMVNKIADIECLHVHSKANLLSVVAISPQVTGETQTQDGGELFAGVGHTSDGAKKLVKRPETRYDLGDLLIRDIHLTALGPAQHCRITLLPAQSPDPFEVELLLKVDPSPQLKVSTQVTNQAAAPREFKIFNYLTNLVFENVSDTHYLYPPPRGTIDHRPLRIRKCYGGTTYMQWLDAFNPTRGAGIYLWPDDPWGQGKIITMAKSGPDPLVDDAWASYNHSIGMPKPNVDLTEGVYLGYEYWERILPPGRTSDVPDLVIGFHTGDWHEGFSAYRRWVQENLPVVDSPQWVQQGALMSGSHIGTHIGANYGFVVDEGIDVFNVGMYWNYPDRPETGGRNEYYYREDWGGAQALRRAVDEAHAKGVHIVFYLEGLAFPAQFAAGADTERLKPQGALQNADGSYSEHHMCPGSVLWQDYLAQTCGRLIRDTGADGVYLDSICQVPPLGCYSTTHGHKYPGTQTWCHDIAVLLRKVRQVVQAANPNAVVYSETPGAEIDTVYLDGGYAYYPDFEPVTPNRFSNPKLTSLSQFLFPGKRNWSLVESLIDPAMNIQAFFNNNYIFVQSTIGVARSAVSPYRLPIPPSDAIYAQVLRKHAAVFNAPGSVPMLSGLFENVYVNKFADATTTIYNIYNSNYLTVRGRLIEVDQPGEYVDEITGQKGNVVKSDGKYYLTGRVGPKEVACYVNQNDTTAMKTQSDAAED